MRRLLIFALLASSLVFAFDRQPNADYRARRQKLAAAAKTGVVLVFAGTESEGPNAIYGFHQDLDFYYLTGWREPGAVLLLVPEHEAGKDGTPAAAYSEILFLPEHNRSQEKWTGPKLGADSPDAPKLTGVDRVEVLDNLRAEIAKNAPGPGLTVWTDTAAPDGPSTATKPLDWLRRTNAFPIGTSFQDVKPAVARLRRIKDAGELALLQHAVDASAAAHLAAMKAMKPGLNEHDISALMQGVYLQHGCERMAYAPIVGSGYNGTTLHYSNAEDPIRNGDSVVIDVAGEYSYYASDITRTLPANGHFTERQREIYNIVLGAQRAAETAFISGKSFLTGNREDSLYTVAKDYINTHGKDLHGEPLGKYFIHGLGHWVGLEVHDAGPYEPALEPGVVFTIEPGIYIPEEKLGVRIEDMYTVGADGKLIKLTRALPSTAEDVERAMKSK